MNLPFLKRRYKASAASQLGTQERTKLCGGFSLLASSWTILGLITSEQKSMANVFSSCAQCPEKMLLFQQL